MDRFGSLTPYWEDAEFSAELSPDPYSEEPPSLSGSQSKDADYNYSEDSDVV